MTKKINIGTRGSQLALYQANLVRLKLLNAHPGIEINIEIIMTKGDKILDVALSKIGDKGLFTKEIETALIEGTVDIAVHSLKDLPTSLPLGLKLGAVLERGEFRDAWISKSGKKLNALTENDIVATSSLRRQAALFSINPNAQIIDIRGNVQTRLKKMDEGYCDALIMAAAGLQRLNLDHYITEIINPEMIMPAVAQGAIAIEMRENDKEIASLLQKINHQPTWTSILAERAFLRTLEGGCQVPLGCYSKIEDEHITLHGFVSSINGKLFIKDQVTGRTTNPEVCGIALANKLSESGAKTILDQIRKSSK